MLLTAISCAWVIGILIGSIFNAPLVLMAAGILPIPFIFIFKKQRKSLILLASCSVVLFGAAAYYTTRLPVESPLTSLNNQGIVEIKGTINVSPEVRDNITHIQLTTQEMKVENAWRQTQGQVLLFVPRYPEYNYGDVLWIKGTLENPPSFANFDYQAYLARQRIYSTMLNPEIKVIQTGAGSKPMEWIYLIKERLSQNLSAALPEPQASLAQGIVLGIRSTIPDILKTNLSVTGTAHLLAISGINLTIIAGILITLGLWLFGRRHYIYVWLAIFIIWFYSLLTGMEAPVIRSAIMASIFLVAELLGRQKNAFVALALSAAIMVGITPQILWDISFQLSFLAMVGLIFIAPPIQNMGKQAVYRFFGEEGFATRIVTVITDSFGITLGALIAVWPVIALNFGIFSIVGPLATFLIAPILSPIIVFGALTALIGLISLPLAQVVGWVAWLFLSYMLWLVNAFAAAPSAAISTGIMNTRLSWIYYSMLVIAIGVKSHYRRIAPISARLSDSLKTIFFNAADTWARFPKKWIIIPLLMLACLTSFTAASMPDNDLHVSILDVGEGDSILVQSGSQNVLIDGGPSPQAVALGLSRKMPFWNRKLEMVILTHPHLDHLSGLIEVLQRYQVSQVLAPDLNSDSPSYRRWLDIIQSRNIGYTTAQVGQKIKIKDNVFLEIQNPPVTVPGKIESDWENNGIVARLAMNKISFLFTADIDQEAEARLLSQRANLNCTVLKVAHHGSATSTTADFLSVARPQIAVISVGSDNTFGHPSDKVITRLKEVSVSERNIFRTDKSGTIEFITDGQNLRVKTDK